MKTLTTLLLALFLLACGDAPDATVEDTDMDAEQPMQPETPRQTLQQTVDAVQANGGDLTALPADAAQRNIDTWIDQLEDVDGADKVTGNLERLGEALGEQPINGSLAGMILITLAEDTRQVAGNTPGISTLVSALESGGEKLTASIGRGSGILDQTLQAVKSKAADITTLPADAAIDNIDGWLGELRGMDGADGLVENLETLKTELGAGNIDAEKVSDILFDLAEDTRDMADGNKGLETLAYALEAGGWRLEDK